MTPDYAAWNKELKKRHAAIQRAWNKSDWPKVIELCVSAKLYFDTIMTPDNWPWYKNMYHDAQQKNGTSWHEVKDWEDIR